MHDPGVADQGMARRRGLLVVDIDSQAGETAVVEGGPGGVRVDEAASGRVHNYRARLDPRERGLVQKCGAVVLSDRMKADEV